MFPAVSERAGSREGTRWEGRARPYEPLRDPEVAVGVASWAGMLAAVVKRSGGPPSVGEQKGRRGFTRGSCAVEADGGRQQGGVAVALLQAWRLPPVLKGLRGHSGFS